MGITDKGAPSLPGWLLYVRIVMILVAFGVLVAAGLSFSTLNKYKELKKYIPALDAGPASLLIFDSFFTWILLAVMLTFEFKNFERFYYRIGFVFCLALNAACWLVGWAWAADIDRKWYELYNYLLKNYGGATKDHDKVGPSLAAGAVMGALEMVLAIVVTFFYVRACRGGSVSSSNSAELGQMKH